MASRNTSVVEMNGDDQLETHKTDEVDNVDHSPQQELTMWCKWVLITDKHYYRQFVRGVSLVNLIVLCFSLPWKLILHRNERIFFIQFTFITVADFLLACIYTIAFVIRIKYHWQVRNKNLNQSSTSWYHFLFTFGLMSTMWYSVAIGIYRSIKVDIPWPLYLGLVIRATLAVPPVIAMFLSSFFEKLKNLLKWRQLAMVTMFYFIFMFLLALMGVHLIGGLNHACVYRTLKDDGSYSIIPAVPFTHCNPHDEGSFCATRNESAEGLVCAQFPPRNNNNTFDFNYRSYVYYGQFTVILDAFFAVYEASTLELWSFMMYTAIEGRGASISIVFYIFLTFFIVVILQQSIFLVVIIESFADLRSQSFFRKNTSSVKAPSKPTTVLSLQNGSITLLTTSHLESSVLFIEKYHKKLVIFEKVFLVLVIIDAFVTASKHNSMTDEVKMFLQVWQVFASAMFVIEILLIFLFHIYHGQWKLYFRRPYYLCLIVLAVGGMVGAIPLDGFYNPLQAGNGLAIFQSLRFPRLLRLQKDIHNFAVKIMGKSIPILSLITICMITWLAVVNAQIFGYRENTGDCSDTGAASQFAHFFDAFESTFQIVTNEAWTDVTSEVMCHSNYWFVTNLYFIVMHLFSSLIFLNFFGAVILDNLEYDEEEKKAKLEEIKDKQEESVPPHLNIYKMLHNKPKKLKIPPGIGKWNPNLEEAEVRRFFETANTYNLTEDSLTIQSNNQHNDNPLKEMSTNDIAAILEYIKLWRRCNEEESSKLSQVSYVHHLFGQSLHNRESEHLSRQSNVRSEYDVFREKYQYFDMALFCMAREHKLRMFCTKVLEAQARYPNNVPSDMKKGMLHLIRKRLTYISKWVISRMTYSMWAVFLGLFIVISVQLHEYSYTPNHIQHTYTIPSEIFYLLLMISWLILKVISRGCFLNPHAAINSLWDVIDWILVLDSAILFILLPLWCGPVCNYALGEIKINIAFLPSWCIALFAVRSLRSLHIISLFSPAKAVVSEIVKGWRNLLKAMFLMFGFMFMFASLGVQLFSGTYPNPLAFCNDPTITTMEQCTGQFNIKIELSREFLSLNDSLFPDTEIRVSRVWYIETRDFSFNNVGIAFVTLFELLTLEGWPEVRDLLSGRNSKADAYMGIYMHVFVFVAVNIGLQLFLGIVVNNFNEQKPGHTSLLSVDQNRWVELLQRISLLRPYKLPKKPSHNKHRRMLYTILTKSYFRFVPTIIIGLSALTLIVPWNDSFIGVEIVDLLITLSIVLNCYTIVEMSAKVTAFGPAYFRSHRNKFDLLLSMITFVYLVFAVCSVISPSSISHIKISYFALGLAIAKLLTVLVKYSSMLNLLLTVISTVISSISLSVVLFIVSLCYAMLGVTVFSNVRSGEAINYHLVNFNGIANALIAIWRSVTGEDWYQIMWDAAVQEPYCHHESLKNCGSKVISVFYFGSFTFIVAFILLNVFIAVLLEKFSIFYNDEETNLDHDIIKDFKHSWRLFDIYANGNIPISRIKLLLRTLKLDTYYTSSIDESGKRIRKSHNILQHPLLLWEMEKELQLTSQPTKDNLPVSSEIRVKFGSVIRMLAYRCEDINKRLEPQELFTRKEQEHTLQLDVAQECILKWMKKNIQPILQQIKQERESHQPLQQQDSTQSITGKRQRFRLMHNIESQNLLQVSEWTLRSVNSEDEEGDTIKSPAHLMTSVSEDLIEDGKQDYSDEPSPCSSRSFIKMKQKHKPKSDEKIKQWFQIQEEWMENVKTNKDYFDDFL